jgi:EAL domain-containing protein (putative c-di-GMP-specific phosphodiesterase class I)
VETKQAFDMLLQMGAQYGQGYYFRSPYPMDGDPDTGNVYQPAVA